MMKVLLFLLFAGLALAGPGIRTNPYLSKIQDESFRPGREYLYRYDTQVLTGFTEASKIQAGFCLSCVARLQFNTATKVRVQFEEIFLYRINEPVVQWKASESLMPEEFLKELTGVEAITMTQFLQIPFGFEWDNGWVVRILLDEQETTWSANLKRGFTSLFEMNLEKRLVLDESYPAVKSPLPPHANWYNVVERSPVGDCVTLYTVTLNEEAKHSFVTKVRDYNRCLEKPVYINSIIDGTWAKDAELENPLTSGATVKYSLRGTDKRFLILSAVGEGKIILTPYKNQEYIRTSLNQTLHLQETKLIGREVPEIPEIHHGNTQRDSLTMTMPTATVDCRDPFIPFNEEPRHVNSPAEVYTIEQIYTQLKMAARNNQEISSEESLVHMKIVKDMLKTTPETILMTLWQRLSTSKVEPQATLDRTCAKLYWTALVETGTTDSANVVLDICSTDVLMSKQCNLALGSIVLRVTPTTKIINKVMRLTRTVDKQTLYLSLGTMAHRLTLAMQRQLKHCHTVTAMLNSLGRDTSKYGSLYITEKRREIETTCSRVASAYSQSEEKILMVLRLLAGSSRQEDKILALKAIGNAGLPGSLPILKKFLENPEERIVVRIMAIIAHRRLHFPETSRLQAIKTLLKTYLTTTETNEIRTMAFMMMNILGADLPVLESVASSLHYEKDAQVSSFVYSFLTTFANSTYNPDVVMQKRCLAALKFAPVVTTGLEHSFMRRFTSFNPDWKRGDALTLSMVGDMTRYLGAALNWETYNYGLNTQAFEVGFNTEGLSPLLNTLFGPKGLVSSNKALFDLLSRQRRDITPQLKLNKIFETLRIKTRSLPSAYAHMYFCLMGNEFFYLDFDKVLTNVKSLGQILTSTEDQNMRMNLPIQYNNDIISEDELLTLPTEAGLPISLNFKTAAAINLEGSFYVKMAPYKAGSGSVMALHAGVDLTPKVVVEMQSTMGVDMFYLKPVVGNRGLIKFNIPIKKDFKLDLFGERMHFKLDNPVKEKPAVEMLFEPFSEWMLITMSNQSPVFMADRRTIYAHEEVRVLPISHSIKLEPLGCELTVNGQLPLNPRRSWFEQAPLSLYSGRSLLNFFWKPLEKSPDFFTIAVAKLSPMVETITTAAKTYREILTTPTESNTVTRFDKFGRPLPLTKEDVLPYSDPIDLESAPLSMQRLCNKFQNIFNKPMPFWSEESSTGFVILLDASTKMTTRQVQFETLLTLLKDGRIGKWFTRLWRSSLPNYDDKEWQMFWEMGVTYPLEVNEPKDIFDPEWQQQLMYDLEHHISLQSHKIMNQGIDMTILSALEQLNYPAMVRVPTYRILDSLVPEQLYSLMNMSSITMYNRKWDSYWRLLGPVYRKVSQELRINVDPFVVNRDLLLVDHLKQILKVQELFLIDLNDILSKTTVAHAELPIIQWIDFTQAKTVYMIQEIFNKAIVRDLIHDPVKIQTLLTRAKTNIDAILTLTSTLLEKVSSVSQEIDEEGKPVVVYKPDMLHNEIHLGPVDRSLRLVLIRLSKTQLSVLGKIQHAISTKKWIDMMWLTSLWMETRDVLNLFDETWKQTPIVDPVVKQTLLMVTVQNEFCVELLEQYRLLLEGELNTKPVTEQLEIFKRRMMLLKENGVFFGERVATLYHQTLMSKVLVPLLTPKELPIYMDIAEAKRQMVPELREFMLEVAYNSTNMRNPTQLWTFVETFWQRLTVHATKMEEIETTLIEMSQVPKLYLMSELWDALHCLKHITEYGLRVLYTVRDDARFPYLEKLNAMTTKVQNLISGLSPIFTKYSQMGPHDIKNSIPVMKKTFINPLELDLQDVLAQQKVIKDTIRRPLPNVLYTALRRCELLQETLKQRYTQIKTALEQKTLSENEKRTIYTLWFKVLFIQDDLYADLIELFSIQGATGAIAKIGLLHDELMGLQIFYETTINNLKQTINTHGLPQGTLHSLTPYTYLPTGMTALVNITWGNNNMEKHAWMQLMASRSVEQILHLFKQMNAVLRGQDIVYSVNHKLSDEPWLADGVMQTLNTFNHLHLIGQAEQEQLPEGILNCFNYIKDFLKATYWNNYVPQEVPHILPGKQIQAMLDISTLNKELDLYVLGGEEVDLYRGVKINSWGKFPLFQNYKPVQEKLMSYLTCNNKPTTCFVSSDKIYTFDKVNYQLPSTLMNNEVLLAADCADLKSFAVTMRKSNSSLNIHTVTAMDQTRVVEITPGYLDVEVKVDGHVIVLENNRPVVFSKDLRTDVYNPSLRIVRKGLTVHVEFPLTGISLVLERTFFKIQVSEMFKRKVCGLCSNFDGQMSWEFEGPKSEIYTSPRLFVESYIVGESNVHSHVLENTIVQTDKYQDVVSHSHLKGSVSISKHDKGEKPVTHQKKTQLVKVTTDEECKPVDRTVMKKRRVHSQVCFSAVPVKKCPNSCPKTVKKQVMKVPFICLKSHHHKVPELKALAAQGVIVNTHLLDKKQTVTIKRNVRQAVTCDQEEIED